MGQHKYNPTAIAAKKGELPSKPPKMSKREVERMLMQKMYREIVEKVPTTAYFTRDYFSKGD